MYHQRAESRLQVAFPQRHEIRNHSKHAAQDTVTINILPRALILLPFRTLLNKGKRILFMLKKLMTYFWGGIMILSVSVWVISNVALTLNSLIILLGLRVPPPGQPEYLSNPLITAAITVISYALLKAVIGIRQVHFLRGYYERMTREIAAKYQLPWYMAQGKLSHKELEQLYLKLPQEVRDNAAKERMELNQYCADQNKMIEERNKTWVGYAFLAGVFLIFMSISHWLGYIFMVLVIIIIIVIYRSERQEKNELKEE